MWLDNNNKPSNKEIEEDPMKLNNNISFNILDNIALKNNWWQRGDYYRHECYLNNIINLSNQFIKFNIIHLEKNKGLVNALNIGLKICKYDIVFRMDSDDIMNKNRLMQKSKFTPHSNTYKY